MAPTRSKKRKSTESTTSVDMPAFSAPPQLVPTKLDSPYGTPSNRSPIRKPRAGITMAQKQALIDNLQLEITERARKLRAQYMLQAQGLRTRIEIRINRIPTSLRKVMMGDLLLKHSQPPKQIASAPLKSVKIRAPPKNLIQAEQSNSRPGTSRGQKRHSDDISTDKENQGIDVSKKRVKGESAMPLSKSTSRLPPSPSVLSPRSANSRTLPRSPIRPVSPQKSFLARPISPVKPTAPVTAGGASGILTSMVEKAKSTRNAARKVTAPKETTSTIRGRKAAALASMAPPPSRGRVSDSSDASAGTVITRKSVPVKEKAIPVKKSVMGTLKGMTSQKKVPAAAKSATASAPAGGRVLRKRN